jgi:hypothetical protein
VQLHGYADESAPGSDLVVSAGPRLRSALAERIAAAAEAAGFAVCRPWVTGCAGLGATTNVQARWADEHGGEFVHIEVAQAIRLSRRRRDLVAVALAAAVNGASRAGDPNLDPRFQRKGTR